MRKVLLVVDTPARDLKTVAMVSYWLARKHGIRPIVTTTKNELAGLLRHAPDMIVMPHVRYERNREVVEYARSQGIQIAVLPSEGLPWVDDLIPKSAVGRDELRPYVDLLLSWGPYVADCISTRKVLPPSRVRVTGCPRFDIYRPEFQKIRRSKSEFCADYGLDLRNPVLLWLSSTSYANSTGGPGRSAEDVKNDIPLLDLIHDHQETHSFMLEQFKRHAAENPGIIHLVKPHPQEPPEPYRTALASLPNARVVDSMAHLDELIAHADIQLNWRCTTSLESWLMDIAYKTISMEAPTLRTSLLTCLSVGNDHVSNYEDFRDKVAFYLQGGSVPEALIEKRREYISKCLYLSDSSAAENCSDAISGHLRGLRPARRNWAGLLASGRYCLASLRRRSWAAMRRPPGHPKHMSAADVRRWIDLTGRAHSARPESPACGVLL